MRSVAWSAVNDLDDQNEYIFRNVIIVSLMISIIPLILFVNCVIMVKLWAYVTEQRINEDMRFCEKTFNSVITSFLPKEYLRNYRGTGNAVRNVLKMMNKLESRTNGRSTDIIGHPFWHDRGFQFTKRSTEKSHNCSCKVTPGPKGLPGQKGKKGSKGRPGVPGVPGHFTCDYPVDVGKICTDPCPTGVQGPPGPIGIPGDRGEPGPPGSRGKNGEHGEKGKTGQRGPRGIPGVDGESGEAGEDAMATPFEPGPPGDKGDHGKPGPRGPRGMPGINGPPGPRGRRGPLGRSGKPGAIGPPGIMGSVGEQGEGGSPGICPTYCASDGGIFFTNPPE